MYDAVSMIMCNVMALMGLTAKNSQYVLALNMDVGCLLAGVVQGVSIPFLAL